MNRMSDPSGSMAGIAPGRSVSFAAVSILPGLRRKAARVAPLVAPFFQELFCTLAHVLMVLVRRPLRAIFPADFRCLAAYV